MSTTGSVTGLMDKLAIGLQREETARTLVNRYRKQIVRYASRRLTLRGVPQGFDGEDAAQHALAKVCRGIESGRLRLAGRDDFRRVLQWSARCVIINELGKSREENVGKFAPWDGEPWEDDQGPRLYSKAKWSKHTQDCPDALLEAEEECRRLLDLLDEQLREIARLKLVGFTNEEIGRKLDLSPPTVERKLGRIRKKWSDFGTAKPGPRSARDLGREEMLEDVGGITTIMDGFKGLP